MWIAKMKFWHENSMAIPRAQKHNVTILAFLMNTYKEGSKMRLTSGHFILGEEKNVQDYMKSIRKDKRLKNIEIEGNFLAYSLEAPAKETHLQMYVSPEIMFIKPVIVKPDGFEYLECASWDKKHLSEFLKKCRKWLKVESISIKKQKISDVFIPHLMPKLTEKQKKALLLAYQHGYYDYPKKANIGKLAKAMKCSASTFQEHLRRAEEKAMPFLLENIAEKRQL